MKVKHSEVRLTGVPICRGIAIGNPLFMTLEDDEVPEFTISSSDIPEEISRYRQAIKSSKEDVKRLQRKLQKERILEGAAILDTHIQMMQDPLLTTHVEEQIQTTKKNAEYVFHTTIKHYQKKFQSLADPFFRERFKDIQDISRRVMGYLRKSVSVSLADIPQNSIVFSYELTASEAAEANHSLVSAFVTTSGGATSHAAIVAKAKGIPFVTDVDFQEILNDTSAKKEVIVDGRKGEVIFSPKQETLKQYRQIKKDLDHHIHHLSGSRKLVSETIDGCRIRLSANIDWIEDVEVFNLHGGEGVGLFRSECIFLSNDVFPTEEEQFHIYQLLVKKIKGLPIVIRTFDFGGDKLMMSQHSLYEGNSFLSCRSIRYLLKERDIFKGQLSAILRASAAGNVSIMFPMISALSELLEAKEILAEAKTELRNRGVSFPENIKIGCMIEVPSAAIISDLLVKECDFLSIGTNDLVQYSLAVDRRKHSASGLYAPTDPSVLRMIKLVVNEANQQQIPVTVCGEMAADPRFTSLLLGLGIKELSVAPRFIPVIKRAIRNTSIVEASHLAERALTLKSSKEIYDLLSEEYKNLFPEDLFFHS